MDLSDGIACCGASPSGGGDAPIAYVSVTAFPSTCRGEYSLAARGLNGTVQSVRGRTPHLIMRRSLVRLLRSLVPIDLAKVVRVWLSLIAKNIEPQAAWLIAL